MTFNKEHDKMILEEAKARINLKEYIERATNTKAKSLSGGKYRISPCPFCGHKDHFTIYEKTNSYSSFSGCCTGGTIVDFLQEYEGYDEKDAIQKVKDMAGVSDIAINNMPETIKKKNSKSRATAAQQSKYDFTELIERLHKNPTNYYRERGFSNELINRYKLGYEPGGYNAALKDYPELHNKIKKHETYNYIIPIWDVDNRCRYFLARIDETKWSKKELENNKVGKVLNMRREDKDGNILAGPIRFFNDRYLMDPSLTGRYIFICEGWADALTVEELGYHGIAINSASNVNQFLKLVKEYKKNLKDKVLIVCGDNDASGTGMNERLQKGLKADKIKFDIFIIPQYKDLNEHLIIDRTGLEKALKDYIEGIESIALNEDTQEEKEPKGVFEYNNCYCKWVGKGDSITIKEITNFIIEPLELIHIDDKAMELTTNIITKDGKCFKRTFNIADLMGGYQRFKKALQQLLIFDGKDGELEAIKRIILSKPFNNRKGVTNTGFHYINNKWVYVTGNKAIDQDLKPVEDIVMLKSFLRLDTILLDVEPITKEELTILADKLLRFNDISKTATIIGHTAAIFLKEKLWNQKINFNHLLIIGEAGSGKSQTVRHIIKPILGLQQNPIDAGNCTKFAIIRTAASSNTMPFIIEEYKPSKIGKYIVNEISEFLRNSYDHYQAIRGNADQTVNEYDMLTPAILIGEDGTDETAIIERSLQVNFSKLESQNATSTAAFMFLKDHQDLLNKLGRSLLNEALKMDTSDVKRIHDEYIKRCVSKDITSSRIINSVANAMLGITLLKKVFKSLGVDFSLTGYSEQQILEGINKSTFVDLLNENKTSKTVIDIAIEVMDRMASPSADKLYPDVHFRIYKENLLALNIKDIYDIFRKYVSEYKITECEDLSRQQFTKQLSKMPYYMGYENVPLKSNELKIKYDIRKKVYLLSIKELRNRGLDLDHLIPAEDVQEAAATKNDKLISIK